jgi:hypothetical protein
MLHRSIHRLPLASEANNMEKNIPLIKLTIRPEDETTGVEFISFVDRPAIDRQWQAFNAHVQLVAPEAGEDKDTYLARCIPAMIGEGMENEQAVAVCETTWARERMRSAFAIQDEDKRIVSGPAMVAGLPIYRKDPKLGEYYCQFDADTIRQIVYRYFKSGRNTTANVMHAQEVAGVYVFESWLIDDTKGVPQGFDPLPNGSWFVSFRVENDDVWAKVKAGEYTGFSVEGLFSEAETDEINRQIVDEVVRILSGQ